MNNINNINNIGGILGVYIKEQMNKPATSSTSSYSENGRQVEPENEAAVVDAATKLARNRGIDWQVYTNNTNGTSYYYNDRTKETTWEKPPEVANAEAKEGVNPAAAASPEETVWSKKQLLDEGWNKELAEEYVQNLKNDMTPKEAYDKMSQAAKLASQ